MTTLNCFLDLAVCPVSYDAVVLMVKAELHKREIGASRMHVCVVGEPRKKPQYDEHEARYRLWHIVLPAAQLFGATVTYAADWLQAERLASQKDWKNWPDDWRSQNLANRRHLVGDLISAANAGKVIPKVRASQHARSMVREYFDRLRRPVVTMTLRKTYLEERNSDRGAWGHAQRHIEGRGYAVVCLDDTSAALIKGQGYGELDLDLRCAMYQEAACNLQANNGAASLCWFGDKPYRMFGAGVPAEEWDGLFIKQGLPLGESWPWAQPGQRLVYGKECREQIIAEFESWCNGGDHRNR